MKANNVAGKLLLNIAEVPGEPVVLSGVGANEDRF
jgi:hypothetical protein